MSRQPIKLECDCHRQDESRANNIRKGPEPKTNQGFYPSTQTIVVMKIAQSLGSVLVDVEGHDEGSVFLGVSGSWKPIQFICSPVEESRLEVDVTLHEDACRRASY